MLNISFEEFYQHVDRFLKEKYEKIISDLRAEIQTLKNELSTVKTNHENVLKIASEFLKNAAAAENSQNEQQTPPAISEEDVHNEEINNNNMEVSEKSDDDVLSTSKCSDCESSDFSDWIDTEDKQKLAPPKRKKKKQVELRTYSPSDPGADKNKVPKNVKLIPDGATLNDYKPPQWLSEVMPTSDVIQMGDKVVYIRQAHEQYFETVKSRNIYKLKGNYEPWRQLELKDHEFCKVIGIKSVNHPPRFYTLKLAILTEDGLMTDNHFKVKYIEIPDSRDFIILKHEFDESLKMKWKKGDRFRSLIDKKWWFGRITSHQALSSEFPNSSFMCLKIKWDERDTDLLSPWDIKPVDRKRMPKMSGDPIRALPNELLYKPGPDEWLRNDHENHRRILYMIDQVMSLEIAEPFLKPVDLDVFPTYAYVIEDPTDLTTIRTCVQNYYYRQITAAQDDVRNFATNAEKFYKRHSQIVKNARIVTDLMLKVLSAEEKIDVAMTARQLEERYLSSDDEDDDV